MSSTPLSFAPTGDRQFEVVVATVLPFAVVGLSLFSPYLAYFVGALSVFLSARAAPRFLPMALLAFANAGALVFASRDLDSKSSDFLNYFDVFEAICSNGPAEEGLRAFGVEMGLPLLYKVFAEIGLCGLSKAGLAYLQGLVTSYALLQVGAHMAAKRVPEIERPIVVTGLALLLSFFFMTQLSRQALSTIFLLYALWLAPSRRAALVGLLLATLSHGTAPILYVVMLLLRRVRWWVGVGVLLLVVYALTMQTDALEAMLEGFVDYVIESESLSVLEKLLYYVNVDDTSAVASDVLTVVYLALASLPMLLLPQRSAAEEADARMLFSLTVLCAALLVLPLAATRIALPLGSLAVGYFVFLSLGRVWRPLAYVMLCVLALLKIYSLASSNVGADHALWTNYAAWSSMPGYFASAFFR